MRTLRNEGQKDNRTKFFWDAAKIALASLVLGPITKPKIVQPWVIGFGVFAPFAFALLGLTRTMSQRPSEPRPSDRPIEGYLEKIGGYPTH